MTVKAALILGAAIILASALLCLAQPSHCAQAAGAREDSYRMVVLDSGTTFMVETSTGRVFKWFRDGNSWMEEKRRRPWAND